MKIGLTREGQSRTSQTRSFSCEQLKLGKTQHREVRESEADPNTNSAQSPGPTMLPLHPSASQQDQHPGHYLCNAAVEELDDGTPPQAGNVPERRTGGQM